VSSTIQPRPKGARGGHALAPSGPHLTHVASLPCCNLALRTALHHQRAVSCVLNRTYLSTEGVVTESLTPGVL
jgi:hypothetical protein